MINKNINYINKDFSSFKNKLINFAKTYYPNTYNDFSESSPGMMLIEMVSYVGDVLSLYQENQIQETFLQYSKQRKNLLSQAYVYGYRPQVTSVSNTILDIYQLIPSQNISGTYSPNFNYGINIDGGFEICSSINPNLKFYIEEKIDFNYSSSYDITEINIHSLDGNNNPEYYLLKKQRKAYSGEFKTKTYNINDPEKFKTITLNDDKIIKIINIIDDNNNIWYEVPYLSQDIIFDKILSNNDETRYILKPKRISNRFISRFKDNSTLEIQFGSGVSLLPDEEIIPNFTNIGLGLNNGINNIYTAFDPSNFTYTKTYGKSPYDTTLYINYLVGGGIESNTPSNTINILSKGNVYFTNEVDSVISNFIINSLSFTNETPSIGGGNGDSNEDLKLNSLSSFPSQLRMVTKNDYNIRALSLPPEFGNISKVYTQNNIDSNNYISLFILSKDKDNNLKSSDDYLKLNLKTYLNEYKMLTESIEISDAFIINIGLNFDIIIKPEYISKLVINDCITSLIDYFNIDKWEINQPIILSDIYTLLNKINGVQNVKKIEIYNISGEENNYSKYSYDIKSATINNIIYPSFDPCIFELKKPNININGRSSQF